MKLKGIELQVRAMSARRSLEGVVMVGEERDRILRRSWIGVVAGFSFIVQGYLLLEYSSN